MQYETGQEKTADFDGTTLEEGTVIHFYLFAGDEEERDHLATLARLLVALADPRFPKFLYEAETFGMLEIEIPLAGELDAAYEQDCLESIQELYSRVGLSPKITKIPGA